MELARKGEGRTHPNPPVGAVIVKGGRVVGEGFHKKAGGPHAEIEAIKSAGKKADKGALYVTLEPCSSAGKTPPCTKAIIEAGIEKVFIAIKDPNPKNHGRGIYVLRKAGIRTVEGTSRDEAFELITPFRKLIMTGRPYLTLKIGMTIDGKIADFTGKSKWITGKESRALVHDLRRRVDAVMVGGRTAVADDPSLLCTGRRDGSLRRIIVDSSGKLPFTAKVLNDSCASATIVATTEKCAKSRIKKYEAKGAEVWVLPGSRGGVSVPRLIDKLGKAGLMHVLCEGGGELAFSLIKAGVTDNHLFFIAAKLLGGGKSVPSIGGDGWSLNSAPNLKFKEYENVGEDILIRAVRK